MLRLELLSMQLQYFVKYNINYEIPLSFYLIFQT